MSFPPIQTYVFPVVIYAHSKEDAEKVRTGMLKAIRDHAKPFGTEALIGIEYHDLKEKK